MCIACLPVAEVALDDCCAKLRRAGCDIVTFLGPRACVFRPTTVTSSDDKCDIRPTRRPSAAAAHRIGGFGSRVAVWEFIGGVSRVGLGVYPLDYMTR